MKKILFLTLILTLVIWTSCKKDDVSLQQSNVEQNNDPYEISGVLENSSRERMRNAILELSTMKELFTDKKVVSEIYYLSSNKVYKDYYVSLKDLLEPENSKVYSKSKLPVQYKGAFKNKFKSILSNKSQNKYPNLNYLINNLNNNTKQNEEDWFETAEIVFYIPYFKDEDTKSLEIDADEYTIVPAVMEADEAIGYKYTTGNDNVETVMTNDDYAQDNLTIIVQPENTQSIIMPPEDGGGPIGNNSGNLYNGLCSDLVGPNQKYVRQVFVGHGKLIKQYDKWVSLTGNGGGSEIIIARVGSREYLEYRNDGKDVIINNFSDQVQIDFSRKDIRNKKKKWLSVLWDANWECSDPIHEQLFVVYEEDKTDPINFEFSGIKWGDKTYGAVNLKTTVRTKDEIIRILKRDSDEFFASNLLDNGCGTWRGENSFSDKLWPIYDCGANFSYTMPHRWIKINN